MKFITAVFFNLFLVCLHGQTVTVTDEVNIRNDYAYDLLGQIEDNYILFRDKGRVQTLSIYDANLRFKREKELTFERKRVRINGIVPQDSVFNVYYNYRERDTSYLKMRTYDKNAVMQDSTTLEKSTENNLPRFYRFTTSEDGSKTVLFGKDRDDFLHVKVIDNVNKYITWNALVELGDLDLRDDFRKIQLGNNGLAVLLFQTDNVRFKKDKHLLHVIALLDGQLVKRTLINLSEKLTSAIEMKYNNVNDALVITGLTHPKRTNAVTKYFYVNKYIGAYEENEDPVFVDIGLEFIAEVYGKKIGKETELEDYTIRDLVLRGDGGFLLVTEMDKDFTRRNAFIPGTARSQRSAVNNARGWTDHYNEDIIIYTIKPDGTEHWRKVLFKKQFSQDDGGVFSSFFIFKTPSRLKLLYNDEIKNNNTASEYILNPLGKYERNSLLSTDYQNLRLRFKDAVQVSNNTILVPSEKNYNLRIVRISYDG